MTSTLTDNSISRFRGKVRESNNGIHFPLCRIKATYLKKIKKL